MPVSYACKCGNVRLAAARQAARYALADLSPTFVLDDMVQRGAQSLQCLVCGQAVYEPADDGQVEVLLAAAAASSDDEPTRSTSVLPLDLSSFTTSSADVYPSTPRPPATSPAPPPSSLLPALPDPLFLPPPFTPSHPHFISVSSLASAELAARRAALADDIAAFVGAKRAELDRAEQDVRREVMVVWEAYQAHASPSRAATPPSISSISSASKQPSAGAAGQAPPARDTGFSAGSRGSLNLERRAEAKSASPTSVLIGVPQTAAFAKVATPTGSPPAGGGQASLLGASLARSSYMRGGGAGGSPSSTTVPPASPTIRSPLSPVPSQPSNAAPSSSSGASLPASIPTTKADRKPSGQDLDLATSMRLSHVPSPPNLIFSTTNARAGAALVREGVAVRSRSFEDRAALLAHQPAVLTPPAEEAEGPAGGEGGEQDVAFRESPSAAAADGAEGSTATAAAVAEGKDGKKEARSPKRRVTFKDDNPPATDDDDDAEEEEGTVVGEQEDVFDFEPHSQPSSSSSPPTSPIFADPPSIFAEALSSSLLRSTARSLERPAALAENDPTAAAEASAAKDHQEPLYTLDGRSIHPVPAQSLSPARRVGAGERLRDYRPDDAADDDNKVLVSMRRLTAADLPSHRASYKNSLANGVRKWAMYGRVANSRSPSSSRDPDDLPYQGGQSLPIPLAFPPSASYMATATTLEPLERKTSLSDRQMYVPPLRPAMRSASSSTASSSSASKTSDLPPSRSTAAQPPPPSSSASYAYSQSVGASMDPGPMFDEDDGESESSSGFVAPHLKALEGARSGEAVGWASMVNR